MAGRRYRSRSGSEFQVTYEGEFNPYHVSAEERLRMRNIPFFYLRQYESLAFDPKKVKSKIDTRNTNYTPSSPKSLRRQSAPVERSGKAQLNTTWPSNRPSSTSSTSKRDDGLVKKKVTAQRDGLKRKNVKFSPNPQPHNSKGMSRTERQSVFNGKKSCDYEDESHDCEVKSHDHEDESHHVVKSHDHEGGSHDHMVKSHDHKGKAFDNGVFSSKKGHKLAWQEEKEKITAKDQSTDLLEINGKDVRNQEVEKDISSPQLIDRGQTGFGGKDRARSRIATKRSPREEIEKGRIIEPDENIRVADLEDEVDSSRPSGGGRGGTTPRMRSYGSKVSGIPIHSRYTVAAAASTKASSYRSVASSPKPPASYRSVASSPKPPASSTKPPSSYRSVASNSKSLSSTNYQTSPKSPSSSRTSHRTSPKPSYTSPKSPSPTSYRRDYKAGDGILSNRGLNGHIRTPASDTGRRRTPDKSNAQRRFTDKSPIRKDETDSPSSRDKELFHSPKKAADKKIPCYSAKYYNVKSRIDQSDPNPAHKLRHTVEELTVDESRGRQINPRFAAPNRQIRPSFQRRSTIDGLPRSLSHKGKYFMQKSASLEEESPCRPPYSKMDATRIQKRHPLEVAKMHNTILEEEDEEVSIGATLDSELSGNRVNSKAFTLSNVSEDDNELLEEAKSKTTPGICGMEVSSNSTETTVVLKHLLATAGKVSPSYKNSDMTILEEEEEEEEDEYYESGHKPLPKIDSQSYVLPHPIPRLIVTDESEELVETIVEDIRELNGVTLVITSNSDQKPASTKDQVLALIEEDEEDSDQDSRAVTRL